MEKVRKVVLAYSGGLDTSIIIHWLRQNYGCQVVAFAADVGQFELAGKAVHTVSDLKRKAIAAGASKVYVQDLKGEFVRDYIFPTLKANAVYEGTYLMGTSIARPLIAKKQIEIAKKKKADAVAHGATGKGNDQVRFELTYYALEPNIKVVAPWREWEILPEFVAVLPLAIEEPEHGQRRFCRIFRRQFLELRDDGFQCLELCGFRGPGFARLDLMEGISDFLR